jgi:hypothetical protein
VKHTLISAFNDMPDVRSWLADVLEAISIPGLWEQVRRHEVPSAFEAYREAYEAFLKRYESGLLHRNSNAAYGHRLDHYLSRLTASRMLHDYLTPNGPGSLTSDADRGIRDLLEKKAEAVTNDWLKTTERATGGGIKLNGNQRTDLVRRAANYLECTRRAWRASEVLQRLQRSGPQAGDVARRRERFLAGLSGVRERAVGTPWGALLERLMGGLLP